MAQVPRWFDPDLLVFLGELARHNTKAWFEANRARYEAVYRDAFSRFVAAVGERSDRFSPYLIADPRPVGGSVMRIFRDVRFSKDKSPYRTYTVAHFAHRDGEEGSAPGLFLYVGLDGISAGGGVWHPEPAAARKIRSAIAAGPTKWMGIVTAPEFRRRFELTGDSLKRAPPGFPNDHPYVSELKRKQFVASTDLTAAELTSPRFLDTFGKVAKELDPFMRFLCGSLDLRY